MKEQWFVYELPPIDFGWGHLPKLSAIHLGDDGFGAGVWPDWNEAQSKVRGLLAQELAQEPCVMFLPEEGSFRPAFAFKTVNNGTTYVVTRHRMPWIEAPLGELIAA